MTPSEHLQAAKEAVAKKYLYPDWDSLMLKSLIDGKDEEYCEEAALLALTNQAEELRNALRPIMPYIEDLQKDNYTDTSVGIFEDFELTKAVDKVKQIMS